MTRSPSLASSVSCYLSISCACMIPSSSSLQFIPTPILFTLLPFFLYTFCIPSSPSLFQCWSCEHNALQRTYGEMRSCRYVAPWLLKALKVKVRTLNLTLYSTGNQSSWCNTGWRYTCRDDSWVFQSSRLEWPFHGSLWLSQQVER